MKKEKIKYLKEIIESYKKIIKNLEKEKENSFKNSNEDDKLKTIISKLNDSEKTEERNISSISLIKGNENQAKLVK